MKKFAPMFILVLTLAFAACSKDDSDNKTLESTTYDLREVNGSGVVGKVTVSENKDGSATIEIELFGSTTDEHPAFVYYGNSTGTGGIAITLNACTCATSSTVVTKLDNGTKITYQGIKALNGHIKIHMSPSNSAVVATGNIGVNAN